METPLSPCVLIPETAALNLLGEAAEQGISPATSGIVQLYLPERRGLGTYVKSLRQRLSGRSRAPILLPTSHISHNAGYMSNTHLVATACWNVWSAPDVQNYTSQRPGDVDRLHHAAALGSPWPVFAGGAVGRASVFKAYTRCDGGPGGERLHVTTWGSIWSHFLSTHQDFLDLSVGA